LGHAAYFGLGLYLDDPARSISMSRLVGMVAGGVVGALASLPIGWLCFRLRRPYFAIRRSHGAGPDAAVSPNSRFRMGAERHDDTESLERAR